MPKFVLNGEEKIETVYSVTCKTTQYGGGDQEIVLEINGSIVVSLICEGDTSPGTSEKPIISIFKDSIEAQGFELELEDT